MKPIELNNQIYLLILESLVYQSDGKLKSISKKNNRKLAINFILDNPTRYLLEIIKIFDKPELLNKVIFDIEDLEFMFNLKSIQNIKDNDEYIEVDRVMDKKGVKLRFTDIKNSFKKGCVFDCPGV